MSASDVPVLWQYNFSNFNEKARWALDFKGIAHRRRSLMPGFPRAMAFSFRGTVPVLDLDGRRVVDLTALGVQRVGTRPSRDRLDPRHLPARPRPIRRRLTGPRRLNISRDRAIIGA